MRLILLDFREYHPVYDRKTKILQLYGKVKVKDFVRLKALLQSVSAEVQDIRIN